MKRLFTKVLVSSFLSIININAQVYLTRIPFHGARLCHQLRDILTGILWAQKLKLPYVYTPFHGLCRDDDNFFDLNDSNMTLTEAISKGIPLKLLEQDILVEIKRAGKKDIILVFNPVLSKKMQDSMPQVDVNEIIPFLKQRYEKAREKQPITVDYDSTFINIAVHIRRGDVNEKRNLYMFTELSYYRDIIKQIHTIIESTRTKIYIFSEGEKSDFTQLLNIPNVYFCLNEDVYSTFHHLIKADILIGSKSGFSYYAGKLSDGIVIYQNAPWLLKPSPQWLLGTDNGKVNLEKFKNQLMKKLKEK